MLKKWLFIFIVMLSIGAHNVRASEISQIRYLKAVVLKEDVYLMDNSGKLVITKLKSDEARTVFVKEEMLHLPLGWRPAMSNPTDIHLFWDMAPQGLYVIQQSEIPYTSFSIIKLSIPHTPGTDDTSNVAMTDASNVPIDISSFGLGVAVKRIGLPLFASLYVTSKETRMGWIFQGSTLTEWASIPKWSSPPGSSALSYIVPQKEYKLVTNVDLPYISFYDKGITYLVDVNGKEYKFSDSQFTEERLFDYQRIPSSTHVENVPVPDTPVILLLNKDTPEPTWLRFVVRDGIAQVASENNGITNANDATTKNISDALNRALKALGQVEWRIDDIPVHPQKKPEPEVTSPTPPPVTETLLWKELPDSKVEGTGLIINRQKTPLTRIPEGFKKPKETLVPPPPGYLYWANYHRWDDGFGYVSHYALWKKELDTQDKSAQLQILDAMYEPEGKDKREPGTFAVAYLQGKVLFATVTQPGNDGSREEMSKENTILQSGITKQDIISITFAKTDNQLELETVFANGDKKQWKLSQANGIKKWEKAGTMQEK